MQAPNRVLCDGHLSDPSVLIILINCFVALSFCLLKGALGVGADADSLPGMKREELNDPSNPNLSYGNNPLHDAARDNDHVLVKKIIDRVPGIFSDPRFHKWDYEDAEDYPEVGDKNDVRGPIQPPNRVHLTSR